MKLSSKCLLCKGRYPERYCKTSVCPLYAKVYSYKQIDKHLTNNEFDSSSRTPFVSRFGYPNLKVGVLAPPGVSDASEYDAPREWAARDYGIPKIMELRSAMVNSRFPAFVKGTSRELEATQEVAMAKRPVSVDITLKHKPTLRISPIPEVAPMGPLAELKALELTENPRVPRVVDKAVSDDELKSVDAIAEMSKKGINEEYLTRLLSVGLLGVKSERKLVPTRWAITATDDTLSKLQIRKIQDFKYSDYLSFFGGYLGNYYLVMLIPGVFQYELFEMPVDSGAIYVTDWEGFRGRKNYAKNTAGGYYAARLAVTERLVAMKRQASALVLRFITNEYSIPLGVWVVREATRKALSQKPIRFDSLELMIEYAKLIAKRKFGMKLAEPLKHSRLLDTYFHQKRLGSFS